MIKTSLERGDLGVGRSLAVLLGCCHPTAVSSQPEAQEPSRAARDALAAIVDQLDLRRRRAWEDLDAKTRRAYRKRMSCYLDWCRSQGLQPQISDQSAREYVNHLRETEELRPGSIKVLMAALKFFAAALDPVPSLVEAEQLALLYRKAWERDGVPVQRRRKRRTKPGTRAS